MGLRNRIAHEYDAINPAKVKVSIEHALPALIDYVRQIEAFVQNVAS